ncbi:fimbrial protein [Citrobacter braakii]|uniref:fimbrial protein n=1 Tax=Citrobacter braakii TaxID=57706 RepID=UPI00351D6721
MKNVSAIKFAMMAIALSAVFDVSAATLTVNGNIVPQTCTIAAANMNQTVTLPTVGASDMLNALHLIPVTFQFGLSGCDQTYQTAAVTLNGTSAVSDVAGFNSVIANTGTAGNVGIGIIGATTVDSNPTGPLGLNTVSAKAPLTGVGAKSGTLYLRAQIVPLLKATAVSPGTVTGTATATFTYA